MRVTEQAGPYRNLEKMSVKQLLLHMNDEDLKVAEAVRKALPGIESWWTCAEGRC